MTATQTSSGAVGILAGGGPLPFQVADSVLRAGGEVFIVGFQDFVDADRILSYPHKIIRLAAAGDILTSLRKAGCRDIVLIGPVRRPALRDLRPDVEGARLLARMGRALFSGDDGLLGMLVRIFGEEGFNVRGAHDYLGQSLGRPGVLGIVEPDRLAHDDIRRGIAVIRHLGRLDIGQSCIVQDNLVLAVEAIEGTDAMLSRAVGLKQPGPGGVLVKILKPGQERRTDMPTIGPRTVENVYAAGLRGLAFETGGTLLTDPEACQATADRLGVFLYGLSGDEIEGTA